MNQDFLDAHEDHYDAVLASYYYYNSIPYYPDQHDLPDDQAHRLNSAIASLSLSEQTHQIPLEMMVADAVDTVSFGIPISYVTHSVPSGGYHSQPIYPVYLPPQEQLSLPAPSPLPLPPPSAVIYQPNPQPLHRTIKWADPPTLEREPSPPPSPVKKRRVYKPIQPIACFFCRTRKIACGPPPGGGEDKTCAQCLRRGYTCEYPTESHRGCRRLTTAQAA